MRPISIPPISCVHKQNCSHIKLTHCPANPKKALVISAKEPYISAKEPCISVKEAYKKLSHEKDARCMQAGR